MNHNERCIVHTLKVNGSKVTFANFKTVLAHSWLLRSSTLTGCDFKCAVYNMLHSV